MVLTGNYLIAQKPKTTQQPEMNKKAELSGVLFALVRSTIHLPSFTTNPPQLHHKNTTIKTRIFANTPCKNTHSTTKNKN